MLTSIIGAGTTMRRIRRCGSEARSRPAAPSHRCAADKALAVCHVERLVGDGHATWRKRRGEALELTLTTGKVFRLDETTMTRIF